MDKVIKAAAIKLITETKGTGFEAGDVKFLEEMPDKSLENIKTLVETKIAAEKTAADLKAAEEKAEEEKKTAELKAAEEKKNAPPTEDEWLKTAPASIRTLVDRHKKADEAKRTELVGLLKVAQTAYSETELKTMDVDVLERLAMVAKIDYSGRGVVPRRAEAEDDVFSNPPDPYAPGLKAMREQKVQ